jgi:hypothetical protein
VFLAKEFEVVLMNEWENKNLYQLYNITYKTHLALSIAYKMEKQNI